MKKILYDQVTGKVQECVLTGNSQEDMDLVEVAFIDKRGPQIRFIPTSLWHQLTNADLADTLCADKYLAGGNVNPETAAAVGAKLIRDVMADEGVSLDLFDHVSKGISVISTENGTWCLSHKGPALRQKVRAFRKNQELKKLYSPEYNHQAQARVDAARHGLHNVQGPSAEVTRPWTADYEVGDEIEVRQGPGCDWKIAIVTEVSRASVLSDLAAQGGTWTSGEPACIRHREDLVENVDEFFKAITDLGRTAQAIGPCSCSSTRCTWRGSAHCRHNPHQIQGNGGIE